MELLSGRREVEVDYGLRQPKAAVGGVKVIKLQGSDAPTSLQPGS